jgi:gliding motility-associated-like protein
MKHFLPNVFLFVFLFSAAIGAKAANAPSNDSICNATDLGVMPVPGMCPNNGDGDTISFFSTTNNATFNPLEFSVTHCFSSPSPDVWYKLQATGSYLYVEMTGFNGLNNFFVKLHHSQGSCLSLVPLDCFTSTNNVLICSFPTPEMNGVYYLQIGGDSQSETGNFYLKMKSYNDCNSCVKTGNVSLFPAPTFGRYNLGDTVTMCTTVDRWEVLSGAHLHSIVPEFGPDWNLSSLTPVLIPQAVSQPTGWHWMTNIPTPVGNQSGFFFDSDGDNDPSDNAGDNGNVLSSWTGCWKIATAQNCNTNDISVDVHLFSDAETGTTAATFVCAPYSAIHISTSTVCCPAPFVQVNQGGGCSNGNASINANGDPANTGNIFNYTLVDTSGSVIQSFLNTTGGVTFTGLFPGQYTVFAQNLTTSCTGFQTVTVNPGLTLSIQQTFISCTPGQGHAIVSVNNPGNYQYIYNWTNVPLSDQNDSLAFNLPDGWAYVTVTDPTLGCSASDSIYIITEPTPDPTFGYHKYPYCNNADSIPVFIAPVSPGGSYSLVSPVSVGITVDPNTGTIFLNNTTFTPPFWIYVAYGVGINCYAQFVDSVQIVPVPPAPVPLTPTTSSYCIGGTVPAFMVSVPNGMYALWYDVQTTASTVSTSFTPPLSAASGPGLYYYFVVTFFTLTGGCTSTQQLFVVDATASPAIASSAGVTICSGDSANLSVSGCSTCNFLWTPAPTSGNATSAFTQTSPQGTTTYTVTATDQSSGCMSVAFQTVTVNQAGDCFLNYYSGITPNGDGHNDSWVIDGIDSLSGAYVEIYNRWGQKIWDGNNYDNVNVVWRGTDKNQNALTDGTYYFVLITSGFSKSGWIELSH